MPFDEARLDDPAVLATADLRLRGLAESGARVRLEATSAREAISHLEQVDRVADRFRERPRAVIVLGAGTALVERGLAPTCPVPLLTWDASSLPSWVGALDLVVAIAPDGGDPAVGVSVAEARRRGCRVLVAAPADSVLAAHLSGADTVVIPSITADLFAVSVAVQAALAEIGLGTPPGTGEIADALDLVAIECAPRREFSLNPAKLTAIALSETVPLVWGGSTSAADAAAHVAGMLRRATGRPAVADDGAGLLPVVEAARVASIFDDPVNDGFAARPAVLILDDGADLSERPMLLAERRALVGAADARNVRVEVIAADTGGVIARYARLLLSGRYAAEYLQLGQAPD